MAGLVPKFDNIVVKRDEPKTSYGPEGTIIIPDSAQDTCDTGVVMAVGGGEFIYSKRSVKAEVINYSPLLYSVGDHVAFGKYSGKELVINGEKVLILSEDEIFGTIE